MHLCTGCYGLLVSAGTASHTATLSIGAAACRLASCLRMGVLETAKLLDEQLYSRQL